MLKRGQVTIFLILGIIILCVTASIFYLVSKTTGEKIMITDTDIPFTQKVRPNTVSFVESCIESTAAPAILALGLRGGYLDLDLKQTLFTENESIAFSWYNGKNLLDKNKIAQQLSQYIENNILYCLDNFSVFYPEKIEVTSGLPKVKTIINIDQVVVNLNLPLTLSRGDQRAEINEFQNNINIRLGLAIQSINDFNEKHRYLVGWDSLLFTAYEHFITVFPYSEDITILSFYDPYPYHDNNFIFTTAVFNSERESAPQLSFIEDFVLSWDVPFTYQVEAEDSENDKFVFTSNSLDFPISEDGLFNFTPSISGTFNVTITVTDKTGLSDSQPLRFVVERSE